MAKQNKVIGTILLILGIFLIAIYFGFSLNSIFATTTGTITINLDNIEQNIQVTKEKLGENQLLVAESFSGGSTISKYSMRYPIIQFSKLLPTIIIDSLDNSVNIDSVPDVSNCNECNLGETGCYSGNSYICDDLIPNVVGGNTWISSGEKCSTDTLTADDFSCQPTIYNKLEDGSVIQVPETQTYTLFYIIENNYQLPTICDIVDAETGLCAKISPGIVFACSEGQFDPSLGLCVIQPESRIICPEGGRFDVSQGVCIWNPNLQAVCSQGIYNVNTQTCQYTPIEEAVCDIGFTYNPNSNRCEVYPETTIYCPGGYAYDVSTDECIKYPDSRVVCPTGSTFNLLSSFCEYDASGTTCQEGFNYNSITDVCEYKPSNQIICGDGTYDSSLGTCVIEPPTQTVCNSGGILTDIGNGNQACIYTPESISKCPQGTTYNQETDVCEFTPESEAICPIGLDYNVQTGKCEVEIQIVCVQGTYDSLRNGCVYEPNIEYLCVNGELTIESGQTKCIITPETTIVCPNGFAYDDSQNKCVKNADILDPTEDKNNLSLIAGIISFLGSLIFFTRK